MALRFVKQEKKAFIKGENTIEKTNTCSLMSSGLKFRRVASEKLGITARTKISLVADVDGDDDISPLSKNCTIKALYLFIIPEGKESEYKTKGTIGENLTVKSETFEKLIVKTFGVDFKIKDQVIMNISETPVEFEGLNLYELTLNRFVEGKESKDESPEIVFEEGLVESESSEEELF